MGQCYAPLEIIDFLSKTIKISLITISVVLFALNVSVINAHAQQSGSVTTGPAKSGNAIITVKGATCTVAGACVFGPVEVLLPYL
jgi:hypothetical protein